jgi:mono/diheme cytochrome c family protein
MIGITLLFISVIPALGQEKADARALFETKCSGCHKADKATSLKKTPKEWQTTVTRMKDVRKAPVNDEEAAIITKYLSENYGKEAKR